MKNIKLIFLMILGIYSCSTSMKNNGTVDIIAFTEKSEVFIPDYVDSVFYLKLQTCEEAFLSHLSKVIIKNDQIYIGDFIHHKIVVYNMDGSFNFSIDKKGRAPQEYLEIKSFSVDDSAIYIIDNFRRNLQIYDVKTGDYVSTKKMPFVAWDLEVLNKGKIVFAYSPLKGGKLLKEQPNYRLFFTDKELNVLKTLFPFSNSEFDPIAKNSFFTLSKNKVIYNWCINDDFYAINKDCIDSIQMYTIDFGDKKIPQFGRQNFNLINNRYNYIYATPVINGNFIAFEVAKDDYFECYLYDICNRKMASNPENNMLNTMSFPQCIDEKGHFLYIIENKEYYDDLIADGFFKASEDFESHLEDGIGAIFML